MNRIAKLKETLIGWLICAAIIAFVWFMISAIIFAFRHPWMTDMERLLHTPEAFMLKMVAYKDARP